MIPPFEGSEKDRRMPTIYGMDDLLTSGFVPVNEVSLVLSDIGDNERGGMIIHAWDHSISIFAGLMPFKAKCVNALVRRLDGHTGTFGDSLGSSTQRRKLLAAYRQMYTQHKLVAQVFIETDRCLQTSATVAVPIPLTVPEFQSWVDKTVADIRNNRIIM